VVDTRRLGRSQPIVDLSRFVDSQRRSTRDQHSNSQSHELRGVLELGPSQWSLVEALARKEPYPYCILEYHRLEREESRIFDSQTHELKKAFELRPGCGCIEM
jgi:hypothetical protein